MTTHHEEHEERKLAAKNAKMWGRASNPPFFVIFLVNSVFL
jgi:hypothetical protein